MKFSVLMNMKILTFVGIFIFISIENSCVENSCSAELSTTKFYNRGRTQKACSVA